MAVSLLMSTVSNAQDLIDSLKTTITNAATDSARASAMTELSRYFTSSYPDSTLYYATKGFQLASKINNEYIVASSAQLIGIYYRRQNNPDSALHYFKIAEKGFDQGGSPMKLGGLYISLGNYLKSLDRMQEAHEHFFKALELFESIESKRGIGYALVSIGTLYTIQDDIEKARTYFLRGYKVLSEIRDPKGMSVCATNLGTAFFKMDQLDSAYYYFKQSQPFKESKNDRNGLATLYNNLGIIFTNTRSYDSARYYLNRSLKYSKDINNRELQIIAYNNLGEINTLTRRLIAAEAYLDSARRLATAISSVKELSQNLKFQYKLDSVRGNYLEALKSYQQYRMLDDSLSNVRLKSSIAELETKYETEKKERHIESLAQLSEIQTLQIKQQRYLLIGGAILLLVIVAAGFLITKQRKIQQQQKIYGIEQRLLRTQMNPHFLFNALMSIQQYLFQNQPEEAGIYMSKFAKLMRQILEHSRCDYISVAEEVETLENYIQLQQLRFKDRFQYEINIDEEIEPSMVQIPPMFAQPFIENAIEHGLANKNNDGQLIVNFKMKDDLIQLEINDNGVGITQSESMKAKYNEHKSLATQITKERIAVINAMLKKKIELLISSVKNDHGVEQGTKVSLMVPAEWR